MFAFVTFLLVVGPIILVHEFGHWIVARRLGMAVHRFSIGMGPVLASFRWAGTRFCLSALPLGGYVLLRGASQDEVEWEQEAARARSAGEEPPPHPLAEAVPTDVPDESRREHLYDPRSVWFIRRPVWQRMAVMVAGAAFNVLFAFPLLTAHFWGRTVELPLAEVGYVVHGMPAQQAGLVPGDRFLRVEGRPVRFHEELQRIVERSPGQPLTFDVEGTDGRHRQMTITPDTALTRHEGIGGGTREVGRIGIGPNQRTAVVHVPPDSPWGGADGLQTFDRIIALDGVPLSRWAELTEGLRGRTGEVTLTFRRMHWVEDRWAAVVDLGPPRTQTFTLPAGGLEATGLVPAHSTVVWVAPGSPADTAGLRTGDRLLEVDGLPAWDITMLDARAQTTGAGTFTVTWERDGLRMEAPVAIEPLAFTNRHGSTEEELQSGIAGMPDLYAPPRTAPMPAGYRLQRAMGLGFTWTTDMTFFLVRELARLISGRGDPEDIGGPIMLANLTQEAARQGLWELLFMAAAISVNVGLVNLLPIPGLDGGQLLLLLWEGIRRRPPTPRVRRWLEYLGLACILLLFVLAFRNDFVRYWQDFAQWINATP
jgi:regulator of sigma E protease